MVVKELNIITGKQTNLVPVIKSGRCHDVERVESDRLVVADIAETRVLAVNMITGILEWRWLAQFAYSINDAGSDFTKHDRTHLSEFKRLPDGRFMKACVNTAKLYS